MTWEDGATFSRNVFRKRIVDSGIPWKLVQVRQYGIKHRRRRRRDTERNLRRLGRAISGNASISFQGTERVWRAAQEPDEELVLVDWPPFSARHRLVHVVCRMSRKFHILSIQDVSAARVNG